jgi:hypothetical protein
MLLSSLIGSDAKPYLEYAWVCAPNLSGQGIAANTITTLYLSEKVGGDGTFGSLSAGSIPTGTASATSQVTLAAGTYYYDALVASRQSAGVSGGVTLGLYNITAVKYISIAPTAITYVGTPYQQVSYLKGQFTVSVSSIFDLRILSTLAVTIDNGGTGAALSTLATAGADQRTTLKLWKLA